MYQATKSTAVKSFLLGLKHETHCFSFGIGILNFLNISIVRTDLLHSSLVCSDNRG